MGEGLSLCTLLYLLTCAKYITFPVNMQTNK